MHTPLTTWSEALTRVWETGTDETTRREESNWRGVGRLDDAGWASLVTSLDIRVRAAIHRIGSTRSDLVALDWGCGGGAGATALAAHCRRVYGVDVSRKNLHETERQVNEHAGSVEFRGILVSDDPTTAVTAVESPVDLFFSTATFHVLPSQEYGEAVLRTAYAMMSPGAAGFVQIRYDDGTPRYAPRSGADRYEAQHSFATSWPLHRFWTVLEEIGFSPHSIGHLSTANNFAGFYFVK